MPNQHVSRVRQYLDSGATIQNSSGDLEAGGGGGAGLRAISYALSGGAATYTLSFRVRDESGAAVTGSYWVSFRVQDDYADNTGFGASCLVKGVSAGSLLNTSNGGTAYPYHLGTTNSSGVLTFQVGPTLGAIGAQRYILTAAVTHASTTPPAWASVPVTVAFTSTP